MKLCTSVCLLAVAAAPAWSAATGKKSSKPYNTLVAFGDQLVDNGNGSYAHGLDPNNAYGYHTWTDGPVVPSYLADLLGVPLVDYAWGGAYGGGLAGPTIDNDYTPAKDSYNGQPVPSSKEQVWTSNDEDSHETFVVMLCAQDHLADWPHHIDIQQLHSARRSSRYLARAAIRVGYVKSLHIFSIMHSLIQHHQSQSGRTTSRSIR